MMKSTLSSKNSTSPSSTSRQLRISKQSLKKPLGILLLTLLWGFLSSCDVTYPAKTITQQLEKLAKDEENMQVSAHITGKTLWLYVPLVDLIKEEDMGWDEKGLEKTSKALSLMHRAILSSDAELDFAATVASDVKNFGVQLTTFEYLPDVKEAILEKFSRGEFFMRSVKDVSVNPAAVKDMTGESMQYYDISFNHFLGLQVIHRTKGLFAKDAALSKIFELKSTALNEKFGIIKIDLEFLKKTYILSPEETKIKPLDYVKMIAAEIAKNYHYKDLQAFEIKDTFSGEVVRLDIEALKKIKIKLPKFKE